MDASILLQAITSVGFPIVLCLIFCWFIKYKDDNYRTDIHTLIEKHEAESKDFIEAIDANTSVMRRLLDKLNAEECIKDDSK